MVTLSSCCLQPWRLRDSFSDWVPHRLEGDAEDCQGDCVWYALAKQPRLQRMLPLQHHHSHLQSRWRPNLHVEQPPHEVQGLPLQLLRGFTCSKPQRNRSDPSDRKGSACNSGAATGTKCRPVCLDAHTTASAQGWRNDAPVDILVGPEKCQRCKSCLARDLRWCGTPVKAAGILFVRRRRQGTEVFRHALACKGAAITCAFRLLLSLNDA